MGFSEIEKLALSEITIHQCLQFYRRKQMTKEDVLIMMVQVLVQQ
ncbi:hypothetical protein [Paenibacillus sp. FSL H7-0331]|nr:hypothetical protein [Paenibacillus sp. FSL H7-0331]